jgi:hypothetical protein
MSTVAIVVEGVLRRPTGGQPIREGIDLYYGMSTRAKIILLTEQMRLGEAQTELDYWLMIEGMAEHSSILFNEPHYGADRVIMQVNKARAAGMDVAMVVEADPAESAKLIKAGYNVLTFSHAEYAVPMWRPDFRHHPSAWDDLVARVEHEALLRAMDTRRDDAQEG